MVDNRPGIPARSHHGVRPSGPIRSRQAPSAYIRSASWVFIAIALLLIGVLAYYLTLTTRPEISQIIPEPNSSQVPGPVELGAIVTSQRNIDEVRFFIDGESVAPDIEQTGNHQWTVSYEQVFERGERHVVIQVTDSSGRVTEHSWTFESGGELVPPRLALSAPPAGATLEPGLGGIVLQVTTFAEIDNGSWSWSRFERELEHISRRARRMVLT
jgi:hypothetical protein